MESIQNKLVIIEKVVGKAISLITGLPRSDKSELTMKVLWKKPLNFDAILYT
jgi:hypothetical protein